MTEVIIFGVVVISMLGIIAWLEARRRDAVATSSDFEIKLVATMSQLEREREEKRALETTIDRAHDRLNELVRERKKIDSK